jgi:hypothetical protein
MMVDRKDLVAGILIVLCGGLFCFQSVTNLRLGTALRMGPGYFPMLLSLILIGLGMAILVKSFGRTGTPFGKFSWRATVLIVASPVLFAVTVRGLGFALAMVLSVIVAAFASRRMTLLFAVPLAVALSIFCTLVFKLGLGLPLKTFGPWLGG